MPGLSAPGRTVRAAGCWPPAVVDVGVVARPGSSSLGVLGAFVWWQLTPLAEFTRTATNAQMDEEQLGRQVAADGWFFVVAAVGGLLSGMLLAAGAGATRC